ncbi:hypothetical protein [Desulfobacula sp.]|uniref:Uncharacterized protein n=1 Tax=Candidatus Desulfatibia vada TaxID=2841696 RepID=A0A8J6NZE7_9BACT|nr:hypothetical protein [Candidatus Desulfatibia vada]MBL6994169.1 hypothetical protein [Desulfobacula sp.]
MRVIWWEDEPQVLEKLEKIFFKELRPYLNDVNWRIDTHLIDWDLKSKEEIERYIKGQSQIWIIDIGSDKLLGGNKKINDRLEKWLVNIYENEKEIDNKFAEVFNKVFIEYNESLRFHGIGLAIIAKNNNIPFIFCSKWREFEQARLCEYILSSSKKETGKPIIDWLNKYEITHYASSTIIKEEIAKIRIFIPHKELYILDTNKWRIIRGSENRVVERPMFNSAREDIKILLQTYSPHHHEGGGMPSDEPLYKQPEEFSKNLFTPEMRNILIKVGYDIALYKEWIYTKGFKRPCIRALIQDDDFGEDFRKLYDEWRKEQNININLITCNKPKKARGGNHLWFNVTRMFYALSFLIEMWKDSIYKINIYRLGSPSYKVKYNGILCCIYSNDSEEYYYNELFPSSAEKNGKINIRHHMGKFCWEIFQTGSRWIFYSNKIKRNKEYFSHIVYPNANLFCNNKYPDALYIDFIGYNDNEGILADCKDIKRTETIKLNINYQNKVKPPTIAFHISPEIIETPFKNKPYDTFLVKENNKFSVLDEAILLEEADELIKNIMDSEYNG